MTAPSHPASRADALKELKSLYDLMRECGDRWQAARPPGRWGPPENVQDEIMSDLDAYGERVRQLEAFLVGGAS